ncbi:MAG TPA: hypothetical protein VKD24_03520 [Candidatus Angelobacter sp.]|nr:hypothetical protein [Candidatus Angelobacter sp.]
MKEQKISQEEVYNAYDMSRRRLDELADINDYKDNRWIQQIVPMRTRCFRCRCDSDVVHVPFGAICMGDPAAIAVAKRRKEKDVTNDVIEEFAKIGWRIEPWRSYCPTCKALG